MKLLKVLSKPIAFHRCFAELTGSISAGLMLSQAFYWSDDDQKGKSRIKDPDGWFWKTQEEWYQETMLTRKEQESARRRLREITFEGRPLWSEQLRGVPAKLYYRLDLDILECLLAADQYDQKGQTSMTETDKPVCPKGANKNDQKGQALIGTETTTENTSKTTTERPTQQSSITPLPDDADTVGDAIEDAYPYVFNDWNRKRKMVDLVNRVKGTPDHVRKFREWLSANYPKKSDGYFSFLELFPIMVESLNKASSPSPAPVTYCGNCSDGWLHQPDGKIKLCPCRKAPIS